MHVHVSLPSPSVNVKGLGGGEIGKRLNSYDWECSSCEQIFGVKRQFL